MLAITSEQLEAELLPGSDRAFTRLVSDLLGFQSATKPPDPTKRKRRKGGFSDIRFVTRATQTSRSPRDFDWGQWPLDHSLSLSNK